VKLLEAMKPILEALPDEAIVVSANGYISRALFALADRPGNFYMLGSMGLASSIGLGLAISRPSRTVLVLDGDGNLLMNLGTLTVAAALAPANYVHVCLDNGAYASTGNQPALSRRVDLGELARAAGYRLVREGGDETALANLAKRLLAPGAREGPAFVHVPLKPEEAGAPGERVTWTPEEIRDRVAGAAR